MSNKKQDFINLTNPPAMEVILGISIEDDPNYNPENLNSDARHFRQRFPHQEEFIEYTSTLDTETDDTETTKRHLGYTYKDDNNEELAQFKCNNFTYNKLGDYPGGKKFIENAASAWEHYKEQYPNCKAQRIGLRYINVITVKNFDYNFEKFFNVHLKLPDEINRLQKVGYQYITEFSDKKCKSVVRFKLETVKENAEAKFILDIDTIKNDVPSTLSSEDIIKEFKDMRWCKNTIFFKTIKDEVLEQYK